MENLTRRRLFAMLPLPGIAVALDKFLPKSSVIEGASGKAVEMKPGRRYLMHIDHAFCAEDVEAYQRALNGTGLDIVLIAEPHAVNIYDVGPSSRGG